MSFVRSAVIAALVAVPLLAAAADLPVTFTTQEKPLKAAVSGTPLTFALYRDAACTTQVYATNVNVENVALITKIKQFTPKNDTKLPNTVMLQHTLPGVTAYGNLYLKVTGAGITPVAGACQAQAAVIPAPTCNDGIKNGSESDVDCGGGTCGVCTTGNSCNQNSDCNGFDCQGGVCQPSCVDGIQNQGETDLDCGGPNCPGSCNPGQHCLANQDCFSNICSLGPEMCL